MATLPISAEENEREKDGQIQMDRNGRRHLFIQLHQELEKGARLI